MAEREHPPMEPGGWALESAVARSEGYPDEFLIPSEDERRSLAVGQGAKLLLWIESTAEHIPVCERMWVLVVDRLADGFYAGVLESTPETLGGLVKGDRLVFGPEHVADIYTGDTS